MIKISVPIYDYTLNLCETQEELDGISAKLGTPLEGFLTVEARSPKGNNVIFMFIGDKPDITQTRTMKVFIHEVTHASMSILGNLGVDYSYDNQEALCYLNDFIFTKLLKRLIV